MPPGADRAVFLDRDGTISTSEVRDGRPYAPTTIEAFAVLPEAPAAVQRLRDAGFRIVVVTNQRDVGDGITSADLLEEMHERLRAVLPVDAIEVCTCGDGCESYKPAPGMLLRAADRLGLDLARSFMVGDRWRDVGAGAAAGCTTVFIDRGYDEALRDVPDHVVNGLNEAVDCILAAS